MNIRVDVQINGQGTTLQFHSARIKQELFAPNEYSVEFGFPEYDTEKIADKILSEKWFSGTLDLLIYDMDDKNISKRYIGLITNCTLQPGKLGLKAFSRDIFWMRNDRIDCDSSAGQYTPGVNSGEAIRAVLSQFSENEVEIKLPSLPIYHLMVRRAHETKYDYFKRLLAYEGCIWFYDGEKFYLHTTLGELQDVVVGLENILDIQMDFSYQCRDLLTGYYYNYLDYSQRGTPIAGGLPPNLLQRRPPPDNTFLPKIDELSKMNISGPYVNRSPIFAGADDFIRYLTNKEDAIQGKLISIRGITNHPLVSIGRTISSPEHYILKQPFVVTKLEAEFSGNVYHAVMEGAVKGSILGPSKNTITSQASIMELGTVVGNIDDNQGLGRVAVKLHGGEGAFVARVLQTGAGGFDEAHSYGTHYTPRAGDEVLVGFERGDPCLPIVLGSVYNSEHKPDFITLNGTEEVLVSKSPQGSEIRMLDKENSKKIHIHCPGGSVEVVAANIHLHAGNQIEIQAKKIDISAEEKITMTAKDIEMNVQNNLVQSAGNEAELKATTSVKINSTQVESSAAGNNVIKGAIVQIN